MNPRLWAEQLVGRIEPELQIWLAEDPENALREAFGLRLITCEGMRRSRGDNGWCDGISFVERGEILFVPTPRSNRQHFTLLHEFGHHLIDDEDDEATIVWYADQPQWVLEHTCDLVAASLLLPSEQISAALENGKPTGRTIEVLTRSTNASREVCAIAIAQRLGCEGFAVLTQDRRVTFASRSGSTSPVPWRGDTVPVGHHLLGVLPNDQRLAESFWPNTRGESRRFYMSAYRDDRWTYGLFAEHDLWGVTSLHLPDTSYTPGTHALGRRISCRCGYRGYVPGFPCSSCRRMDCPQCGRCECDWREAATERDRCRRCTVVVRANLLENGLCDNCR